ncbi:MAG TPA: hypothetical protein VG097_13315 [Gemmata sp.]|jgi:hypothetical protein|nr:hypothetical protein [Gemmata sp.]
MNALAWLRLKILEEKLKFGAFGKYNRYRCWCLERNVKTTTEKLRLAREVSSGPGVSILESQHNVSYLRKHSTAAKETPSQPAKENVPTTNPELHGTEIS